MEGVTAESKNPGKEDVDALDVHSEPEGGDEEVPATEAQGGQESASETAPARAPLSDAEVQALSGDLYSKAIFKREEGACVIWNASGTLSLRPGSRMKIEGKDYETQSVIHEKHLVMACTTKKE